MKQQKQRRVLALILAAAMTLQSCPIQSFASEYYIDDAAAIAEAQAAAQAEAAAQAAAEAEAAAQAAAEAQAQAEAEAIAQAEAEAIAQAEAERVAAEIAAQAAEAQAAAEAEAAAQAEAERIAAEAAAQAAAEAAAQAAAEAAAQAAAEAEAAAQAEAEVQAAADAEAAAEAAATLAEAEAEAAQAEAEAAAKAELEAAKEAAKAAEEAAAAEAERAAAEALTAEQTRENKVRFHVDPTEAADVWVYDEKAKNGFVNLTENKDAENYQADQVKGTAFGGMLYFFVIPETGYVVDEVLLCRDGVGTRTEEKELLAENKFECRYLIKGIRDDHAVVEVKAHKIETEAPAVEESAVQEAEVQEAEVQETEVQETAVEVVEDETLPEEIGNVREEHIEDEKTAAEAGELSVDEVEEEAEAGAVSEEQIVLGVEDHLVTIVADPGSTVTVEGEVVNDYALAKGGLLVFKVQADDGVDITSVLVNDEEPVLHTVNADGIIFEDEYILEGIQDDSTYVHVITDALESDEISEGTVIEEIESADEEMTGDLKDIEEPGIETAPEEAEEIGIEEAAEAEEEIGTEEETEEPLEEVETETEMIDENLYNAGDMTIEGNEFVITVSYGTDAKIPEGAYLRVREYREGTRSYNRYLQKAIDALGITDPVEAASRAGKFVDIAFLDQNGIVIEPEEGSTVNVQIAFKAPVEVADLDKVDMLHFASAGTEVVDVNTESYVGENGEVVSAVSFETDSFSGYGFTYTVDFTYDGFEFSMEGESSILLSEIFARLNINADAANANSVDFTNYDLLGVQSLGNDWMLSSLAPFTSRETLTITMNDGVKYVIGVTDAQEIQESTDLANFLKNVVITGATQTADGKYEVEAGKDYSLIATFGENSTYQFDNEGTLTYSMPEGITVLGNQTGTMAINIVYKGRTYQVDANYHLDTNGKLSIEFDKSDPDYPRLVESTNVSFRFTYHAVFDGSATEIHFSDSVERDIVFNEPEPAQAYASKSAQYDENTGKFNFTVTVRATGDVTDVNVRDVISGDAIIFNNDVRVTGNSSSYTDNGATNGFDYTFASMKEGETITITYSANTDFSKDTDKDGKISVDQTKNTVTVQPKDGDPHTAEYSREITFKSTAKSDGEEAGTTAGGDKIIKWTIDYNPLALASAAGDTITDTIAAGSTGYMKYYGNGITVEVRDKSGNLVDTRNINYSELTNHTDSTWTYTIPSTDTTPYSYRITYQTVVDMEKVDGGGVSVSLNNTANGDDGSINVSPKDQIGVTKDVVSYSTEEITWISTIAVPAQGLAVAVATDTVPSIWLNGRNLYDSYIDGTLEISGLLDGESYDVETTDSYVKITFYKDPGKKQSGLQAHEGGHTITIRLTTKVDQEWLQKGYETGGYEQNHTNNFGFNGKTDSATVTFGKPGIEKKGVSLGNGSLKYTVTLAGVSELPVSIKDTFDTSVLEVDSSKASAWDHMRIFGGSQWSQDSGRFPISYSDTSDGVMLTANAVPMQADGSYYPYYKIVYYLKVKDGVDLEALAIANGGEYDLENTAKWGDHESTYTYKTEYDYLDKKLLNAGELGGTTRTGKYQIVFNKAKAVLNNGEPMTMTDVLSANLSVDYSSIQIITDPAGMEVPYSLSGGDDGTTVATYTVPDSTAVTITYNAEVRGTGSQTIVNKVSVNGKDETVESTKDYGSAGEGEGAIASFKIVKVDGYDANKKLAGVQFKVFAQNPVLDFGEKTGHLKELILTTDENGEITLDGEDYDFYFNEVYHIQEVEAPESYGTISFDYLVTLTNDMAQVDYGHYIYYYSDSMQIKNWPLEGLVVEKQVESDDAEDHDKNFTFRISILKGDGGVDTDYNEKNGDDQFENGVVDFQLKDKEQKMFWGFKKGTKYKVEEILTDEEGNKFSTTVSYNVYDEDGNVTEVKTEEGTTHSGKLTQEDEVIVFKNKKSTAEGTGKILVQKNLEGREWIDGDEFTFTLTANGDTPMPAEDEREITITSDDAGHTKAFGEIEFIEAGTYTYTVKETKGSIKGVTYDETEHVVTLKVEDDGKGNLVADDGKEPIATAEITNTYKPDQPVFEKKIKDVNDSTGETSGWQDSADYDIGDAVPYKLTATLADDVSAYKKYHITFHDTMDESLTFNKIQNVMITKADGTKTILHSEDYELTPSGDHAFELKISWSGEEITEALNSAVVDVFFTATLNTNAVLGRTGNVNTAYLTYSNNPSSEDDSDEGETPKDFVIAFTYKVDVNKVDADGKALDGAEFKLEKQLADGTLKEISLDEDASTTSKFSFRGLDDGIYVLTETNAPAGCQPIDPITFTVDAEHNEIWEDLGLRTQVLESLTGNTADGALTFETTPAQKDGLIADVENEKLVRTEVVKEWNDADNQDGIQPSSVTVQLLAQAGADAPAVPVAEAMLSAANNWKYIFDDLPVYKKGVRSAIIYTVQEINVPDGYEEKVEPGETITAEDGTKTYVFTVINSHKPETVHFTVRKVWDDADNQDGKRPESLKVDLKNGDKVVDTVTLNAENNWKADSIEVAKCAEGKEITYEWAEDEEGLPEGYKLSKTEVEGTITTLTNSYKPETVDVSVEKKWNDNNDQDHIRPDHIDVKLTATVDNAVTQLQIVRLTSEDDWKAEVKGLPKYKAEGKEIEYSWTEFALPEGYTLDGTPAVDENGKTTITNKHEHEETKATVMKVWDDAENKDGKRPETVTMILLADNKATGRTAKLSTANDWTATIDKLDVYDANGDRISYSWAEDTAKLPEGYSIKSIVTDTDAAGAVITTITNTYSPEFKSLTVSKMWDDANDQDNVRPASVKVTLLATVKGSGDEADVTKEAGTVTLVAADNWTATINDLPVYSPEGNLIEYTWQEEAIATYNDGEQLTVVVKDREIAYLTNKHVPEETEVEVTKVWADGEDQDGIRPESVTALLLADGEPYAKGELNEENEWTYKFEKLPVYKNGQKAAIRYTVDEINVPDGYTVKITGTAKDGFTITNTHVPDEIGLAVKKIWDDANDQDGKRPKELVVTLLADGEEKTTVTLNKGNDWSAKVDKLPKYKAGGVEIIYQWTEDEEALGTIGYELTDTTIFENTTKFTNSHTPETTQTTVAKEWEDNDDRSAMRPEHIDVKLLADGAFVKTVRLDAANGWTWTEEDLPKYKAEGLEIKYTWEEYDVPQFYSMSKSEGGNEITNTFEEGKLTITKQVVSNAAADASADYIFTIQLNENVNGVFDASDGSEVVFKDGQAAVTITGAGSLTINGLPKDVIYKVEEADVVNMTTKAKDATGRITADGRTAIFTNTRETGELTISKKIVSTNEADQEKTFHFTVVLDGVTASTYDTLSSKAEPGTFEVDEKGIGTVEITGSNSVTIKGLPAGVKYTVVEAEADEDNFATTFTGDTGYIGSAGAQEGTSHAVFTNTKAEGGLVVSKKVVSAIGSDHRKEFTITVTLNNTAINGTYGDAQFVKGVAELTLTDGDTAVIEGLPKDTGYEVSEVLTDDDGEIFAVEYTGKMGTITKDETKSAVVTNTRKTTGLTITKTVSSNIDADKDEAFLFTLTFTPAITGIYSGVAVKDGEARLWLKNGETETLEGIPYGTAYTVTEQNDDRFSTQVEVTEKAEDGSVTTKAEKAEGLKAEDTLYDKAQTAAFENTRKIGDLKISKKVVSPIPAEGEDEVYRFTIVLNDKITETFTSTAAPEDGNTRVEGGEAAFINGKAVIEITGNGSVTITGLPAGAHYTVVEAVNGRFETTTDENVTGEIPTDDEIGTVFTNTRKTTKLTVAKTVISPKADDLNKEFRFRVTLTGTVTEGDVATDVKIADGIYGDMEFADNVAEFTLKSGESAVAEGLPTGIDYKVEELDENGRAIDYNTSDFRTVISGNAEDTLCLTPSGVTFVNTFAYGEVTVKGTKTLTGRDLLATDPWTFTLEAVDGAPIHTGKDAAANKSVDGNTVETPETDAQGGETPETAAPTVENEEGENTEPGAEAAGNTAAIGKAAGGTETFTFEALRYTLADLAGENSRTFTYRIVESGTAPGVTNDSGEHLVYVTVVYDGSGDLKISTAYSDGSEAKLVNTYRASGEAVLEAAKELEGRILRNRQFQFHLRNASGRLMQTVYNDADGKVAFETLIYDESDVDKTYIYRISEYIPQPAVFNENGEYVQNGYTYDANVADVTVKVTDPNKDGRLAVDVTYSGDAAAEGRAVFTNRYEAEGRLELEARKVLEGADLKEAQFAFELKDADGKVLQTMYNDKAGMVTFDEISYTLADLSKSPITYKISEVTGNAPDYTYDRSVYTIVVVLTDDGNGGVKVTPVVRKITGDGLVVRCNGLEDVIFYNVYEESRTDIPVEKVWKNAAGQTLDWPTGVNVEISLYADGKETGDKKVLYDGKTGDTFKDLPVYDDGTVIEYTVEETKVTGIDEKRYVPIVTGTAAEGFTVTNTNPVDGKVLKRQDSVRGAVLAGAVLQILDGETVVDEWTTTTAAHDVSDILLPGKTYTLHEVSAPEGFELADDITIVVTDEGAITVDGKVTDTITMVDYQEAIYGERVPVIVNKYDKDTMEELAGAVLTVYDPAGKVIDDGNWTSVVGSNVQFMLGKGSTFTLKEETAPGGYTSAKDITITVSLDGEVSVTGDKDSFKVDATTGEIQVLDTRLSMKVEKKDDAGAPVKGAALQILAEDGTVVTSWVTDGTARDVSGYLQVGRKYKLHESVVPYGYKAAADIEFTVTADGKFKTGGQTTDTLTMIDARTTIPGGNTSGSGGGGSIGGGGSTGGGSGTSVSGGSGASVKTGDDTPIMLWLMLLLVSMGAITAAGVTLKKRKKEE